MWPYILRYFSCDHIIETKLEPTKQIVVACHPHGIHCLPLIMFSWLGSKWNLKFPKHKMIGVCASVIFWIPILREIFLYNG